MNSEKKLDDEIARVAYELYEKRGYASGNDFADWIEAEKIVMNTSGKSAGGNGKNAKSIRQSKTPK
jgi:hypothetical protein